MTDQKLTKGDLAQFFGGDTIFRHNLVRSVKYTEGVQYLAERAGAYWLLDIIATNQLEPRIRAEEFQSWKLRVTEGSAVLTCTDGNEAVLHKEDITFTDFPLDEIDIWVEHGTILLPSEH